MRQQMEWQQHVVLLERGAHHGELWEEQVLAELKEEMRLIVVVKQ